MPRIRSLALRRVLLLAVPAAALLPTAALAQEKDDKPEENFSRTFYEDRIISLLTNAARHPSPTREAACFFWNGTSVLVSTDDNGNVDEKSLRSVLERMPDPEPQLAYRVNSRWTSVATDASVELREPVTILYSFVPDGTPIDGFNGEPASDSNLFAVMDPLFGGSSATWQAHFTSSFDRWAEVSGLTYTLTPDDGAAFGPPDTDGPPDTGGQPGAVGVRGDVRIAMHFIDGSSGSNVLAYNFFPTFGGDAVFDSANTAVWSNSANTFRALRNVIMHEHGHGLGYNHVDPVEQKKLMEPFLSTAFDGPQEDDIRGIQFQYGDNDERNATAATATALGTLLPPVGNTPILLTRQNLAIETDGEVDFYSFSVPANAQITLTVTPVGTTYLEGPQNGATANINALAINNLAFDLIGTDGTTVLFAVDNNAVGLAESGSNLFLGGAAGTYFLRVRESSTTQATQRYELQIGYSILGGPTPTASPSPSPTPVGNFSACDSPAVPVSIPDGAGNATRDIVIAQTGTVTDLNVDLDISHTWVGDLTVTLTHVASGTTVVLLDQPGLPAIDPQFGCDEDNIDATLDDAAASLAEDACSAAPPAIGGTLRPTGSLAAFNGLELSGTWRLTATDVTPPDPGFINQWCIHGTSSVGATATPTATASPSASMTATPTASATVSLTASPTASLTASPTASATASLTASPTASLTASPTASLTASPTASATASLTASPTASQSPSPSPSISPSQSPTASPTVATASPTASATATETAGPTETESPTPSETEAPTPSATDAETPTPTDVASATPTDAETATPTEAPTQSPTDAPTASPTDADTPTPTEAATASPTDADTATPTDVATATPTDAETATPTDAPTQSPTDVPPTETQTPTPTDTPAETATASPTATDAPSPTATDAPTASPTATAEATPTVAPSPSQTDATTPTETAVASPSPTSAVSPELVSLLLSLRAPDPADDRNGDGILDAADQTILTDNR